MKEKQDRTPNKKRTIDEKYIAMKCFDVVPFMKQKQRRNKRKKQQKEGTKRKSNKTREFKKKKRERERERERERDREREIEKGGGQKRLRKNKGRDSNMNKKCPFLGGKPVFVLKSKEKKGKNNPPQKKIINKEGLGPSEVALLATSPDP